MNNPISQPYFQCERLDVYRVAVKFHRSIVPLRKVRGAADLRDHDFSSFRGRGRAVCDAGEGV